MGCDPNTLARLIRNCREHPGSVDYWLDRILDATTRATDWDAAAWGFNPTEWMAAERAEMEQRPKRRLASR